MFHNIPPKIQARMAFLESIDARDRVDGTPHLQRVRQVPPETGRFLALMAAMAPVGPILEIGTSAGYSGLWISLACKARAQRLVTFELLPEKVKLARETFRSAGVEEHVLLIPGDARKHLKDYESIAFCFLDAEKDIYQECYDLVIPNLAPGGILIADNAISHENALQPVLAHALADERVDGMIAPIGKGLLLCRKVP